MTGEPAERSLLIRDAELAGAGRRDVLVADGRIARIGDALDPPAGADSVDAGGGALLPGLTDHHLHLASLAAARASLDCGPPEVADEARLAARLRRAASTRGGGDWIRGVGYHASVAGDIDAAWLDAQAASCPVRIQHRGGRLWVLNSRALERLRVTERDPVERVSGRPTGRVYDGDVWLRARLRELGEAVFPDLDAVSCQLAAHGVTAVTDATPHNGPDAWEHFLAARRRGELRQAITLMGDRTLDRAGSGEAAAAEVTLGPRKFHLLESELPEFGSVCRAIGDSHDAGRPVAFHCVTRAELVFALTALAEAGSLPGDRIEHASVTPPELLERFLDLGLTVVTQPVFVDQRGDHYLAEVAAEDRPWLYRLRAFLEAGVPLAGSSDAPFGDPDPWRAMQAAVSRRSRGGRPLGETEALTPEQALALYTSPPDRPGAPAEPLREGRDADLCLLDRSWAAARAALAAVGVRLTLRNGRRIWP